VTDYPAAVIVTNNLIKDYMLNYARSLIYTTSLNCANIIAADASFDMLLDGTASCVRLVPTHFHVKL
jgi:8-amino-7-oxononanoate synthase